MHVNYFPIFIPVCKLKSSEKYKERRNSVLTLLYLKSLRLKAANSLFILLINSLNKPAIGNHTGNIDLRAQARSGLTCPPLFVLQILKSPAKIRSTEKHEPISVSRARTISLVERKLVP